MKMNNLKCHTMTNLNPYRHDILIIFWETDSLSPDEMPKNGMSHLELNFMRTGVLERNLHGVVVKLLAL